MQLVTKLFIASATIATVASAHEHQHAHFHKHQERDADTVVVNDVAVKYIFDGQEVPYAQVCQGLANGTFEWDAETPGKPDCNPNAAPAPAATTSTSAKHVPSAAAFLQEGASSSSAQSSTSSSTSASASASASAPAAPKVSSNSNVQVNTNLNFMSLLASNPGVDSEFPDGKLDCTFKSLQQYGAVPLNYLGYGGFSGVQTADIVNNMVQNLNTVTDASTPDGGYFSYACPNGYMKSQYPAVASSTTLGGVQCVNGKFHLTNPSQKTLCVKGAGVLTLINNADQVISACGTDYPGTERETVPAAAQPGGGKAQLAITDSANYFQWQGDQKISAQYYLNPAGYDISEACNWFTDTTHQGIARGNWAPIMVGLSATDGTAWVGLQSTEQVLSNTGGVIVQPNYSVSITGSNGQTCEFKNGGFYMNGKLEGKLGQLNSGASQSNPGVTCAFPEGSEITATFS